MIPVRSFYPCHGISSDGGPKIRKNVLRCEHRIHEMWGGLEQQEVQSGALRCTFVLKSMIADLDGIMGWLKRVGKLMGNKLCFSEVSFGTEMAWRHMGDESEARKLFGQVMSRLFEHTSTS